MYCYSLPRPDTDSREGNAKCKGFSLGSAKLVLRPLCAEGAANLDSDHNQGRAFLIFPPRQISLMDAYCCVPYYPFKTSVVPGRSHSSP